MVLGFILNLVLDLLGKPKVTPYVALVIMITILAVMFGADIQKDDILYGDAFKTLFFDDFNFRYNTIAIFSGVITLAMVAFQTRKKENGLPSEFSYLIFPFFLALFVLSAARHALVFYLSLETVSVLSYLLIALQRKPLQFEATFKYLSIGVAASAVMLFGISWLVMQTGSLQLDAWFWQNEAIDNGFTGQLPLILFLAGLLFKVTAFPLHIWAPDAYEAGATPVIALLSVAPKVVAAGFLAGFLHQMPAITVLIILTILVGNLGAIFQKDAKRLFAYSSISQAAFLLIPAILVGSSREQVFLLYASVYAPMKLALFVCLFPVKQSVGNHNIKGFSGLGKAAPLFFGLFTLASIALIGLPPTGGFTAKLILFTQLFGTPGQSDLPWLYHTALWVAVASIGVSVYYYLAIPYRLWFKSNPNEANFSVGVADYIIMIVLVLLSVLPFFNPTWIIAR